MGLSQLVLTLLAASTMPLGILYLYEVLYKYEEEEQDEVELEDKEGD